MKRVLKIGAGAVGVAALLAAPPLLKHWMTYQDILTFEAVAHASAENKDLLLLSPRGRSGARFSSQGFLSSLFESGDDGVALEEIPDRFVELLLEKPEPEGPEVRQWFPHTFLWAPRVITNEAGMGTLSVTMPDSLTDWQVTGMSLTAAGEPGGDQLTVATRLDVQVGIRAPERLRVGDRLVVPVVSQGAHDGALPLTLTDGERQTSHSIDLSDGGGQTVAWSLTADAPGSRTLRAALGEVDAVEQVIDVVPTGLAEHHTRSGALLPEQTVVLPEGTARVQLSLVPAAAVLEVVGAGLGMPATDMDGVAAIALGCHLGNDVLRQRGELQLRQTRDGYGELQYADTLADALAAQACPDHWRKPELWRLLDLQGGDGSWQESDTAPLSQLLTRAALYTAAVDHPASDLKTAALFERYGGRVADPLTAAMLLSSGLVDAELAAHLRGILDESIGLGADGTVTVTGALGTRPDGTPATDIDVLAAAAPVLPDAAPAIRAALAAAADPATGWGDGLRNLLVLRALKDAPQTHTATTLHLRTPDGAELGTLTAGEGLSAMSITLPAPPSEIVLVTDGPAAPELGWRVLATRWSDTPTAPPPGLAAGLSVEADHRQGEPTVLSADVTIAPDLHEAVLSYVMPAGAVFVPGSAALGDEALEAVENGDRVDITLPRGIRRGTVSWRVVPTLAGTLSDGGVTVTAGEQSLWLGTATWRVAPSG